MLAFVAIGLFFFDGFLGASYLVALFVPSVMPSRLFEEAFGSLHRRKNLPEIEIRPLEWPIQSGLSDDQDESFLSSKSEKSKHSDAGNDDYQEEMEAFFPETESSNGDTPIV
jgi:hypothetical protein